MQQILFFMLSCFAVLCIEAAASMISANVGTEKAHGNNETDSGAFVSDQERLQQQNVGIDAPYIFLRPNNQTRPSNFTFNDELFESLLQAMMPVNSTGKPGLSSLAKNPQQLPPDVLLNNLLTALLPVLGTITENDLKNVTRKI